MKMLNLIVIGGVAVAGLAQTAYTVKLGRDVKALSARLSGEPADRGGIEARSGDPEAWAGGRGLRPASVPVFIPTTAPLPAAIADESARELLRGFVNAEVERIKHEKDEAKRVKKEEKQLAKATQREQKQAEFRDRLAKDMGLDAGNARRFGDILANAEKTRRSLRDAERAGEATPEATAAAVTALRTSTQAELKTVLGDDWANKLQEVDRRMQENRKKDQDARNSANGPLWFAAR